MDWSKAGATISTTRIQCVTSQCAAVSGGAITAASINAALASAPANSYVLVPAGTYTMSAGLTFSKRSYITLRGVGSNSTFLVWSRVGTCSGSDSGADICARSADTNYWEGPSNTATWSGTSGASGTYTQGATSILLSNVKNLTVGAPIILDQIDNQTDNGGLYVGCEYGSKTSGGDSSAACYSGAYSNGFERGVGSLATIRGQQQIVNVTSISGTGPYTVGITPGIYASNWNTGQSPGAWWATSPVYADAVENISLDHTNGGGGINFFNCTGCWVKGVRSIRNSLTGTGWGHVYFQICNHCTVRDSYFYGFSGDAYSITVEIASDALEENNISQFPGMIYVYNSDCEGCVADYNFAAGTLYANSSNWLSQPTYYHGVVLFSLQEGNIGAGLYADSFHGTHDLNTSFRNRWDGREQNNGTAATSSTVALRLNPGTRYHNAIGNVLGTPGYHVNYMSTPANVGNFYKSVVGAGVYSEIPVYDGLTAPTSMFWGNYDTVTNAVRWCGNSCDPGWSTICGSVSEVPASLSSYSNAVPSSTALPASFVYSSKPSWWPSGKAWPPIGPDVTGGNVGQCSGGTYDSSEATSGSQCSGGTFAPIGGGLVTSIPAMDCYLNVMGGPPNGTGGALTFDASACYPSGPKPPQNLTGVVH